MPDFYLINQAGNWIIEDNGVPGDNISQYRNLDTGLTQAFFHAPDAMFFRAAAGVNLIVDFTDSLGAASLTIGNDADSTQNPDSITIRNVETTGRVTLLSNGSIAEGSDADADADIVAGEMVLVVG